MHPTCRERAAGYYHVLPYALAQQLVELPYLAVQTVLYCSIVYWAAWITPSGANAGHFFLFLLFFYLTLLYFVLLGIAAVNLTPLVAMANVLCSFLFGFFNLMCGFLLPYPSMPPWWQWVYWINPVSWSLYALAISQLGDLDDQYIQNFSGVTQTVPEFLAQRFNWHRSMMWVCLAPLLAFVALFSGFAILALKKINYQRR
jgi:ABC-type multidrug transport system permease subunit